MLSVGLDHGSRVMRVTGQLNDGSRGSQNVTYCQLCFRNSLWVQVPAVRRTCCIEECRVSRYDWKEAGCFPLRHIRFRSTTACSLSIPVHGAAKYRKTFSATVIKSSQQNIFICRLHVIIV